MILHWHRRDLRLRDVPAIAQAAAPVLGLYVFDPARLEQTGTAQVQGILDALAALRESYRSNDGALVIRVGDPTVVLPQLASTVDANTVRWEREFGDFCARRDAAVSEALRTEDIAVDVADTRGLHPPGTIVTNEGTPYQVFTYYWRKWRDRDKPPIPDSTIAVAPLPEALDSGTLPTLETFDLEPIEAQLPAVEPDAATDRLERFCADGIYTYPDDRDIPAIDGTSRLSQDLALGTIGSRTVWWGTESARNDASTDDKREAVTAFQRQLAWREFYMQVLWDRPKTATENYQTFARPIGWNDDPRAEEAWKAGETGYPIVDAGMRQLREEAWMHNRVRMIVASFLTKDLLLDWRIGYAWFREHLLDFDIANNAGGWQWAASTGTDAQPYFRIFNPITQGERYDPDATYIRKYVPELADVAPDHIHEWDTLAASQRDRLAPAYPAPIVAHADRREAAIAMFEAARD